ncbi:MAG: hypothetical protein ACOYYS_08155, partial [Chloroflexota bacterium]
MRRNRFLLTLLAITLLGLLNAAGAAAREPAAAPLGAGFTYQGQLKDAAGGPLTATCDLRFTLWDAPAGGAQLGGESLAGETPVVDGYFTALVNTTGEFGAAAFDGGARWLALSVRCPAGAGEYTPLTPRQALTAAPYAGYALAAPWSGLAGVPAGFADGVDDTGADWHLGGNAGTDPAVHALGTTDNVTLTLVANGLPILRLAPNAESPNLIAGHPENHVTAGAYGATIGGGGYNGYPNQAGYFSTVGGGFNNAASGSVATVSGGTRNAASSGYAAVAGGYANAASGDYAAVAGGYFNAASGDYAAVAGGFFNAASGGSATVAGGHGNTASGSEATVGGGDSNTASGSEATVGGGYANAASGDYATVAGGASNTAAGDYSFVAGRNADNTDETDDGV